MINHGKRRGESSFSLRFIFWVHSGGQGKGMRMKVMKKRRCAATEKKGRKSSAPFWHGIRRGKRERLEREGESVDTKKRMRVRETGIEKKRETNITHTRTTDADEGNDGNDCDDLFSPLLSRSESAPADAVRLAAGESVCERSRREREMERERGDRRGKEGERRRKSITSSLTSALSALSPSCPAAEAGVLAHRVQFVPSFQQQFLHLPLPIPGLSFVR